MIERVLVFDTSTYRPNTQLDATRFSVIDVYQTNIEVGETGHACVCGFSFCFFLLVSESRCLVRVKCCEVI